ncbi:MAG TPA: GDSL-type esterase/lipase family protein [Ktedonobacterales bacterium]|nr:GDSL-type esterase/lipase family protein [Ktedonobacterales bacterium]
MAKRIVFFGDSLTEGCDGASYLALLRERVACDATMRAVDLINAGVGGDTVVNLARRISQDVVPHQPDWVVVFIGVNDHRTWYVRHVPLTRGTYRSWRYFRDEKQVRGGISPARFTDGLRAVVDQLTLRTSARVALCTPATVGESLTSHAWHLLERYADATRSVASERTCRLIDLHAVFAAELAQLPPRPLLRRVHAHVVDNQDRELLAATRGYQLTYDGIHFTRRGAALVAAAMYAWLRDVAARPN